MCIQGSMYLDKMVPLEDHIQEVVVLDVLESWRCVCIYIRLCWNKNANGNSCALYPRKRGDDAGVRGPIFFNFVVGKEWLRVAADPIFVIWQFLNFCLAYYQPYEAMTGPKSS